MENKLSFLHNSISDAQQLIRFIDTKTVIIVTVLGAYVAAFFSKIDIILQYKIYFSNYFWATLILFIICIFICIQITIRIIKPTHNPMKNIIIEKDSIPKIKYFFAKNHYNKGIFYPYINSTKFKLEDRYEDYLLQISNLEEKDILATLTLELLKVNFIRNIKNDRFNILLKFIIIATLVFFVSYIILINESRNISQLMEIPLFDNNFFKLRL